MTTVDALAEGGGGSAAAGTADDRNVLQGFLDGDGAAVDTVRRWVRGAGSPFRARIGGELEDVEQEVLLALTETLRAGRFEGRSSFATYVRRMTLYRCVNRVRRGRRWQTVPADDLELTSHEVGPEGASGAREEVRLSLAVVARMSADCRRLWAMLHEGLGYREMGDQLAVAPGTLRVRVLRCRKRALEEWRRLTGAER